MQWFKLRFSKNPFYWCIAIGTMCNIVASTNYALNNAVIFQMVELVIKACVILQIVYVILNLIRIHKVQFHIIVMYTVGLVLMLYVYYRSTSTLLLETYIYLLASLNKDFDRIISIMLKTMMATFSAVIFLTLVGVLPNNIRYRFDTGNIRNPLGFNHPTMLGFIALTITSLYFVRKKGRLQRKEICCLIISTFFVYKISNNRTSALLMTVIILSALAIRINLKAIISFLKTKIGKILIMNIGIICLTSTYWAAKNLQSNSILNKITDARLGSSSFYLQQYSITFFGQPIKQFVGDYSQYYLDSGYLILLLNYGIIGTIVFLLIYILLFRKAIKNQDIAVIVCAVVELLSNLMEPMAIGWCFSFAIFYLLSRCNGEKSMAKAQVIEAKSI